MLRLLQRALLTLVLLPALAVAAEYQEGTHYTRLSKEVRTQFPDKVEVVEMFGYWCPHCNNFERYLAPWKKRLPEHVDFKAIPVIFRPNQEEFAKAYYVSRALELGTEAHQALFDKIHRQRGWINNKEDLQAFFADFGVTEEAFDKAYSSFALKSQMSLGESRARNYQIKGVPAMVVNGKYLVTAESAGSQREMLKVVDFLVEKEKAAL